MMGENEEVVNKQVKCDKAHFHLPGYINNQIVDIGAIKIRNRFIKNLLN